VSTCRNQFIGYAIVGVVGAIFYFGIGPGADGHGGKSGLGSFQRQ
jgi:hypothetical protein